MKYLLLLIPVLLISCKKDSEAVDQDQIYQSYEMSYNEATDQTTFTANFYLKSDGGKRLKLTGGSIVTVNGTTMNRNGSTYTRSFNGYLESGSFVFTDAKGKEFTNSVLYENYIQNDLSNSLSNNLDCYWQFVGPEVSTGETVSVTIRNQETGGGTATGSTMQNGAYFVRITANQMSQLTAGWANAITTRSSISNNGNWTKVGGKKKSEYISSSSSILIN